ncbi:MAG TPA: SGNH/GDSL hydrolase family protein [Planctomycetota bacterium]|nr:SGNH/GDSL hydrolase family protein [Planctomycetota bacterium]
MIFPSAARALIAVAIAPVLIAGEASFIPLGFAEHDLERHTGMWLRPDLGNADTVLPLRTRVWATRESVTDGVALKCAFAPGSTGRVQIENASLPAGSAGFTLYAKASRPLKLALGQAAKDVGTDWSKLDWPWAELGADPAAPTVGWQVALTVQGPIAEPTWLIIDRFGIETPTFIGAPAITPQDGPDQTIAATDLIVGGERLAKSAARLKAKQPFKLIAFGDSVTAGAQVSRGSWKIDADAGRAFLWYAHLARLWDEAGGAVEAVGVGHGGWTARKAASTIDAEIIAIAGADDLVVLEFGANDMGWDGATPERWRADMGALIARVKTKTDQILVLSPTPGGAIPAQADAISAALRALCDEHGVAGVDITRLNCYRGTPSCWAMMANEYHPDLMGQLIMAEMIAPVLTGVDKRYPE